MVINGFTYIPEFLSEKEEIKILERLSTLSWEEVKMYGVVAKRSVIHYGLIYTFNSRSVLPTVSPPEFIVELMEKSAIYLNISPDEIVETLITHYPIGSGIGWHKDADIFGPSIFGISLKSSCFMKFRIKVNEKYEIIKEKLQPRSAYILSGEARYSWQHSISPVKDRRYSITFRLKKSQ